MWRSKSRRRENVAVAARFGGRHRIVGLLGRGGMGEVYRAEDLTLRQTVALKFLPESVAGDAAALERFRREVRSPLPVEHTRPAAGRLAGDAGVGT